MTPSMPAGKYKFSLLVEGREFSKLLNLITPVSLSDFEKIAREERQKLWNIAQTQLHK